MAPATIAPASDGLPTARVTSAPPAKGEPPATGQTSLAPEAKGYKPYPWRTPPDAADPAKTKTVLTVAELTRQIKSTLERGFPRVCVRGEITGFRGTNPRGHAYFSLKDADACIEVKMWASTVSRLKFKLRDGLQVVVDGSVDVYEPSGKYSLIASRIEPSGEGALALAFQQLKEKLAEEGLLGDRRRRPPRPLPFLPRRIGVVTSRTGAALQDFLRVLYQRHPRASVLICDARVQGEGAAREVVSGLQRLARTDVDVIVLTRGGGSVEDLWTFNEEVVARAIFACPVPVVSAIGHEVDFTIADFVADLRAPTPTAAAQLVAPVLQDLQAHLLTQSGRLRKAVERRVLEGQTRLQKVQARLSDPRRLLGQKQLHLSEQSDRLVRSLRKLLRAQHERQKNLTERLQRKRPQAELALRRAELSRQSTRLRKVLLDRMRQERQQTGRLKDRLTRLSPAPRIEKAAGDLSRMQSRLQAAINALVAQQRARQGQLTATLHAVSPLAVMTRGYAVVRNAEGHVVRGASEVQPGDSLAIQLAPRPTEDLSGCDEIVVQVTGTKPGAP